MISIIIPVLNEEKNLASLIESIRIQNVAHELIFVDGGSTDKSQEIISKSNFKFISANRKGRAFQMNEGAKFASGDILFFLHADCKLQADSLSEIIKVLEDKTVIAGSFVMELRPKGPFYRIYNAFTTINSIFFTYGDAGLFMRKVTFKYINGFKEIPIMEDIEIQQRLRKIGRFNKIKIPIITSSRRFKENGSLKQILIDIYIILTWHLGWNAGKLKTLYPDDYR